jgi:hypothetical protein
VPTVPKFSVSQFQLLVQKTKGSGKTYFPEMVFDGNPASIAVIFREGSKPTIISANFCGLSEEQKNDDRIKLLTLAYSVIRNDQQSSV